MANQLDYGLFEVVELRNYAMRSGKRDTLLDIFEREFIEGQEAEGMVPIGHFRVRNDPDAFVWLRGFPSMQTRARSLEAFYTSDTWMRNRDAANATMIDSDNVLLLRNARPGSGIDLDGMRRPSLGEDTMNARTFVATVLHLGDEPSEIAIDRFERDVLSELPPGACIATFVSEERPNDYPRLPIREERVLVAFGVCSSGAEIEQWRSAFDRAVCETLVLDPAARSLLR